MSPLFARFFMLFAIACAATAMNAKAATVNDEQAQQIQLVIVTQFGAFAQDDADSAFQTATPAVREAIGNSQRFLAMVRGAYPMVYQPAQVSFHKPEQDGSQVLQLVEIKDGEDKSWLALFSMEQQPDSSWRIAGCVVAENRWTAI